MIPLSQPVKTIQEDQNKGVFEIEALYPGYGVSIGNTLSFQPSPEWQKTW